MDANTTIRWDTGERHQGKYANANPLHRLSLSRFYDVIAQRLAAAAPSTILDFGCGEGYAVDMLEDRGVSLQGYHGLDLRDNAIADGAARHPDKTFECADLFDPKFDTARFDVVMALEVLEHLNDPDAALHRLAGLSGKALILSVPHEPWFQLVNLARGRDLIRLGNHPEHVQHWNLKSFNDFVSRHAKVETVEASFPFIIATATPL